MEPTQDTEARVDERTMRRAVAGAAMGNAVEWFDYGIYGYLATSIGLNFFPDADKTARILLVFAGIAIPFVLRPFGGIVLGPLGDRYGRRKVLAFTIVLMSTATFCVGLIPSYHTIGVAAPILLLLARLVQGFSTGGEYGGAATFIAEYAPDRRRGFFGSFLEFGTLAGNVAGAGLATIVQVGLTESALNDWGWRIPFLVAGPLGLVGFYLRKRLADTPAFRRAERAGETARIPLKEVLVTAWPQLLNLIGFVILLNVADYTLIAYMPTYLGEMLDLGATASVLIPLGVMVAMLFVIAPVGSLSDRIGRKPLLLASAVGFLVLSYPAIALLQTGNIVAAVAGMLLLGVLLVLMLGTIGSALPAMFPTRHRYSGFAIGYSTSTAAFGSTAPLVITALIDSTGNNAIPAFYLMGAAAIAIAPILLMPETARVSISHPTAIPGRPRGSEPEAAVAVP
ncbi:MFS transporter [Amycolatopsis acidiphila]|uniref:Putative proline/betaine transporter n=1 Tax=Amycolatopsis acidiphila TaxID=715473 RepID=A0A558ACS0_9PSEU|nr:MFS transporter [Amycolatopsis acidiphila]TVT22070.1 MFS transporter [Amycolatopsis acidiphila]UIJ63609.1 MFS transporter [Amycolatopsis acidiphila]GHG67955.1 MFS transporter [Amycolatopsis acidiphila]